MTGRERERERNEVNDTTFSYVFSVITIYLYDRGSGAGGEGGFIGLLPRYTVLPILLFAVYRHISYHIVIVYFFFFLIKANIYSSAYN